MKYKLLLSTSLSVLTLMLMTVAAKAITLEPNIELNLTTDQEYTTEIIATPIAEAAGIQLRLEIEGGEFISYTEPEGSSYIMMGVCNDNGDKFTINKICIEIVPTNPAVIKAGDKLGSIKYKIVSPSKVAHIIAEEDNIYALLDNNKGLEISGNAGIFTSQSALAEGEEINLKKEVTLKVDAQYLNDIKEDNTSNGTNIIFILMTIVLVIITVSISIYIYKSHRKS